jgi:hypothetical protein
MYLTSNAVRVVADLTRRAESGLVRQAAENAATSLSTLQQRAADDDVLVQLRLTA